MLDEQNQLRLKTVLRILDASLSIVNDHSPVVAAAFRQQLHTPATNLQIDAGIPLDDQLEFRL